MVFEEDEDKKIHVFRVEHMTGEEEKILRPVIDMSYSDTTEGLKRALKTINVFCMHVANIAQIQWEEKRENNPAYYNECTKDFLAYEINTFMFTIYNELLPEIPKAMQVQINEFTERAIYKDEPLDE